MSIIAGREKFWSALVSGGFVAAASTMALYGASLIGNPPMVDAPDKEMIAGAIVGLVTALASAFGAYIATNSQPTNISVPAEPEPASDPVSTLPQKGTI